MAQDYKAPVLGIDRCGEDVVVLTLGLPEGYSFRAGQWIRVTLETVEGPQTRTLSTASAPSDGEMVFATRLSGSAFKRALAGLSPGREVGISAPGGRLRLPQDTNRFGFLVGGVGVTPVRSLVRDAMASGRRIDGSVLLYGNRDESCIPWRLELERLEEAGVRVVHVLEEPPEGWTQERGMIDAEKVRRLAAPEERTFVVAGPPAMIDAMQAVLDELAVPAERRVVESFGPRVAGEG